MKKNLSVLMAAATVVTAVAPVVANADTNYDAKIVELVNKAKVALDEKYSPVASGVAGIDESTVKAEGNKYLGSKNVVLLKTDVDVTSAGLVAFDLSEYNGKVTVPAELLDSNNAVSGVYVVKSAEDLNKALELVALKNAGAKLAIFDKGVKGTLPYVESATAKYVSFDENTFKTGDASSKTYPGFINSVVFKDINGNETTGTNAAAVKYSATIKFKNGNTQTVKLGDDVLDLEKTLDKNGNKVDTSDVNWMDFVSKLGVADETDEVQKYDLPQGVAKIDVMNSALVVEKDITKLYSSTNGYTEAGKDFVDLFRAFNENAIPNGNINTPNGKELNILGTGYKYIGKKALSDPNKLAAADARIVRNNDKYVLVIDADVVDANDTQRTNTLEFRIYSNSQKDLVDLKNDLFGTKKIVVGKFNRLVGADRYQTAIEVSKKAFDDKAADSVVIVGGNALLDGLSAAPLASAKNATVLLASPRTGLSQSTLDEISRATGKKLVRKTVYVVGGYNSVPASVDKVLAEKFGAVVVRIAGADRYQTSKKIAERLVYDKDVKLNGEANARVFYVGGNGAADAMSVAPVAATKVDGKVAPILVVNNKGIDQQTRVFLTGKLQAGAADNYVIGGENSVSTQVYRDVYAVANRDANRISRIAGADRYATNLKILNKFYKNSGTINTKGVVVASGANNALVDAQTAGAFAAANNTPILLAGSKLTDDQVKLIAKPSKEMADATVFYTRGKELPDNFQKNVYQVGGAVSSDAMKVVVDKFGLK